jgi:hypothetical protein
MKPATFVPRQLDPAQELKHSRSKMPSAMKGEQGISYENKLSA